MRRGVILALLLLWGCASDEDSPRAGLTGDAGAAADLVLPDCEGVPHSLSELRGSRATWIFEYAAWCPPCNRFARDANAIAERYRDEGLAAWFVVSHDTTYEPATADDCRAARQQFGLTMPVLYDTGGRLAATFGVSSNDVQIVLDAEHRVAFVGKYADSRVEAEIEAVLATEPADGP